MMEQKLKEGWNQPVPQWGCELLGEKSEAERARHLCPQASLSTPENNRLYQPGVLLRYCARTYHRRFSELCHLSKYRDACYSGNISFHLTHSVPTGKCQIVHLRRKDIRSDGISVNIHLASLMFINYSQLVVCVYWTARIPKRQSMLVFLLYLCLTLHSLEQQLAVLGWAGTRSSPSASSSPTAVSGLSFKDMSS